jgi:hypothetical protein
MLTLGIYGVYAPDNVSTTLTGLPAPSYPAVVVRPEGYVSHVNSLLFARWGAQSRPLRRLNLLRRDMPTSVTNDRKDRNIYKYCDWHIQNIPSRYDAPKPNSYQNKLRNGRQ